MNQYLILTYPGDVPFSQFSIHDSLLKMQVDDAKVTAAAASSHTSAAEDESARTERYQREKALESLAAKKKD